MPEFFLEVPFFQRHPDLFLPYKMFFGHIVLCYTGFTRLGSSSRISPANIRSLVYVASVPETILP